MNSKDKNSILVLGVLLIFIGAFVLFTYCTKLINPWYVLGVSIILQCVYYKPKIIQQFYSVYNAEIGVQRYVPILNEFSIFDKGVVITEIICYVLYVVLIGVNYLPSKLLAGIIGDSVYTLTPKLIVIAIIVTIVLNVTRGIGFTRMLLDIRGCEAEMVGFTRKLTVSNMGSIVTLFIPLIRIVGMIFMHNYTMKLVDFNKYTAGSSSNSVEMEEVNG